MRPPISAADAPSDDESKQKKSPIFSMRFAGGDFCGQRALLRNKRGAGRRQRFGGAFRLVVSYCGVRAHLAASCLKSTWPAPPGIKGFFAPLTSRGIAFDQTHPA